MSDPTDPAKLTETLRTALDSLDQHIEARAREIVADRSNASADVLLRDAIVLMEQVGELLRQDMMRRNPEAREFSEQTPAAAWTSSAAYMLAGVCHERYRQYKAAKS